MRGLRWSSPAQVTYSDIMPKERKKERKKEGWKEVYYVI